jgi:peptidoglycan hydrolase-like protein with peptidoglycan-binding domain
MSTVADIVRVARSQVGYHADGNNHQKYGVWWGMNGVAWCDIFSTWVFHEAGCPRPSEQLPGREGGASVNYTAKYWQGKGLWRPSTQSQPGDLICFDWTGRSGSRITIVEGNVGNDEVRLKDYTAGGSLIWGTCNMQALIASGKGGAPPPPPPPPPLPMPTGVPRYDFPLVLTSPPMQNQHVLIWQQQMVRRGWRIAADGVYGPASMAACRAFQIDKHLEVDGVVGPNTWKVTWTAPVT